jgi:geranylgeranyl pyrophosphate synthase
LRTPAEESEFRVYVDLPLLLYAALTGDPSPARPLAVVTTLVYLGAGALDDVADGECPGHWAGVPQRQIELVGALLLSALPQLALGRLGVSPATAMAMHEALAHGLAEMFTGQLADLAGARSQAVDPADVKASVVAKGGGEYAMFARLAALLAGSDAETVELCSLTGRAMGTAAQLASDCMDIFGPERSVDLSNGTRSLPIALHLRNLDGPSRTRFLHLLDEAQHDPSAQVAVRNELLGGGCLRLCGVIAGLHVQTALSSLESIARFDAPAEALRSWIDGFAFARRQTPTKRR